MSRIIPTELSPESKRKFKELFNHKYHYHLSDVQVEEQGLKLLRLVLAIYDNLDIERGNDSKDMVE